MKRFISLILLIMILSVFVSCGEKYSYDYSDVTVSEPLDFDPKTATISGISLGMSMEEVMNSGVFSEGALKQVEKGDWKTEIDESGDPYYAPFRDELFYNEEYENISLCGKNAAMSFGFHDDELTYLSISRSTNYLEDGISVDMLEQAQNADLKEVESEIYRLLGEPHKMEGEVTQAYGEMWHYYIKDGSPVEGNVRLDGSYEDYEELDFDYILFFSFFRQDVSDLQNFSNKENSDICWSHISVMTKEHILRNTPR